MSLLDCHPIAKLVKAKKFDEWNNKRICGFDELIAKFCCPTAKKFMALENSSNIETVSALSLTKTITEPSKQNEHHHRNLFKLGKPKSMSKGLFATKIVPIYLPVYIYLHILPTASGHLNKTIKETDGTNAINNATQQNHYQRNNITMPYLNVINQPTGTFPGLPPPYPIIHNVPRGTRHSSRIYDQFHQNRNLNYTMNNFAMRHWQQHGAVFDLSQSDDNDDQNQCQNGLFMNPDADPNTPIETDIEFDTYNDKTHSNEIPINETKILEIIISFLQFYLRAAHDRTAVPLRYA